MIGRSETSIQAHSGQENSLHDAAHNLHTRVARVGIYRGFERVPLIREVSDNISSISHNGASITD